MNCVWKSDGVEGEKGVREGEKGVRNHYLDLVERSLRPPEKAKTVPRTFDVLTFDFLAAEYYDLVYW
jgi:hypothetical protein